MQQAMVSTTISAVITIIVFSYMYRHNWFYDATDNTFAGLAYAITAMTGVAVIVNSAILPAMAGNYVGIPGLILGALIFTRFVKRWSFAGRWPLALVLGTGSGLAVGGMVRTQITDQFLAIATTRLIGVAPMSALGNAIMVVFSISSILFFVFTMKQTRALRTVSWIGRYGLIIGFGATYGMAVIGRYALLADRISLVVRDWLMVLLGLA